MKILSGYKWFIFLTKMQFQYGDKGPRSDATTYRPNFSEEDVRDMVEVGIISRELGEKLSRAKVSSDATLMGML